MNKNLVYIVAINMDIPDMVKLGWEFYCNKYNCDFKIITQNSNSNRSPHWERYNIFNLYPDYDNYLYVDADALVHWNTPDFFSILSGDLYFVKDIGSLEWTYNSILGYNHFFNINVNWWDYFTTGFIKFSNNIDNKMLFNNFLKFHDEHEEEINIMQYTTLKKGFDQTPFNYYVREHNIKYEVLSEEYSLGHLEKKDILWSGAFLKIPCYIWQFNGIKKENIPVIMKQVEKLIDKKYK